MNPELTCQLNGYMKDGEVYFPLPSEDWEVAEIGGVILLKTKHRK